MQRMRTWTMVVAVVMVAVVGASCAKKKPPVVRPAPPPASTADTGMGSTPEPPAPPPPVRDEPVSVALAPPDPAIGSKNLDELNRESPLAPVYFGLDSYELSAEARTQLQGSAQVLKTNATWQVTVEGHCDERGTAEYNLSLGERRSNAVKGYLVSLGVPEGNITVISKGKETPFCSDSNEACWQQNRRAHFVITAK